MSDWQQVGLRPRVLEKKCRLNSNEWKLRTLVESGFQMKIYCCGSGGFNRFEKTLLSKAYSNRWSQYEKFKIYDLQNNQLNVKTGFATLMQYLKYMHNKYENHSELRT